ncbi:SDR family NAD(P)-dependent oxidoreductase [Pseudogemmobacter sp. W21_MBD1_M6]|uniref:SDR family NAD(P)-dependent oxidoreductase n=1 Tax=Pseudogemmobacter sp. W21_MBD1_M6 TaxID=3240271 RepID=UPI003F9BF0CD
MQSLYALRRPHLPIACAPNGWGHRMNLTGKHALVTGGGGGIGAAIAIELAKAGADVTITGRSLGRLDSIARTSPRLFPVQMDVANEDSVRDGVQAAIGARGPVAICVANAGIAEGGAFARTSLATWRKTMATNLDGAFLTIQACLGSLNDGDWGRVIAISSIAGVRGLKGAVPYTVSKHGMIGLVRGLSEEYIGGNVTFNAICPGYVETDIVRNQAPVIARRMNMTEDEATAYLAKGNRHRTLLQVDEIATAALWLCDEGSRSVNGQCIQISGGQV